MARVNLEITIGKGEKAQVHTYSFEGDDVPLSLMEASQEGNARMMREGITELLELSDEIAKHLTVRHVKQIGAAIKQAVESPND